MRLVWQLQDVYRLEPAGSHGVWGLDDYGFLGYLFGSGQLRGMSLPTTSLLDTYLFADREDVSPAMILNSSLPATDLYSLSITRIHQLKYGPFHEHSPQLHSIAQGVARWSKVNSGMFKMYEVRLPSVLHDVWNNISRTGGGIGKAGRGTTYPFGRSASMGKFFCTGRSHCVWVWGNDRNYCALGTLSSSHEQFRCDSHSRR